MLAWLASSSGVRTVESGVITEAVEAAEAGTGQCVEPGQGKSLKVIKREENIDKFVNFFVRNNNFGQFFKQTIY